MYGKIFAKMYEGTLYGQWEALVTFQQMIVLCDADGNIDMTPHAIAARTSIPLEIIEKGIKILESPDEYSRTPDQEGRRIERLDAHRPWGWHLVNHAKYTSMQDADHVREQTRDRVRRHREKKAQETKEILAEVTGVTVGNGSKRHTDTDTETNTANSIVGQEPDPTLGEKGRRREQRKQALEVLIFLNDKAGRNYQPQANLDLILARLSDGATVEDLRAVVAKKCREWKGDEKMSQYLRPKTLFNRTNFAQYQGELAPAGGA